MLAKEATGSMFPASPASTAIFGATCEDTEVTLSTSYVAGTLLMRLDTPPINRAE